MRDFPMPNNKIEDGIVVASVYYNEDECLATILVLRPEPPYFRVGIWDWGKGEWHADSAEDHYNIVPAINGETHKQTIKYGYTDLGGDY